MKKTLLLLTLVASLGLAYAANSNSQAETTTLTYSNTGAASADGAVIDGAWSYGVEFTLKGDPSRLTISCEDLTEIPSFSTFDLQSIGVRVRTGNYTWSDVGAYLIDDSKTVLAHATNTVSSASGGSMATFNFNNVTLKTGKTYKLFLLGSSNMSDERIAIGKTLTSNFSNQYQMSLLGGQNRGTLSECGAAWGLGDSHYPDYAPIVSIQGQVLIPEPTTATLSLLALAGLVARRRRR